MRDLLNQLDPSVPEGGTLGKCKKFAGWLGKSYSLFINFFAVFDAGLEQDPKAKWESLSEDEQYVTSSLPRPSTHL